VIYCLVPADEARRLLGPLRRHFAGDPRVQVIVDRRVRERRKLPGPDLPPPDQLDRRAGADRRRPVLPRSLAPPPDRLADEARRVRYVQRMLPLGEGLEREDLAAVVAAARAGEPGAPTELYWRLYERVHSRLSVVIGDIVEADTHVAGAFGRILDAIEDPANARTPLDDLLYPAIDAGLSARDRAVTAESEAPAVAAGRSLAVIDPDIDEPVSVQDRDPRWFGRAMGERDRILRLAGDQLEAIEHIGGTAVPAVAGRPVIDLLVGVERMPPAARLLDALSDMGYVDCGEAGTPGRRLLRRRVGGRFDVHVVEHAGELWTASIAFCDYLRRHPAEAHRWATARREAARRAPLSFAEYSRLRAPALTELLARARSAEQGIAEDADSEMSAA